jgi:hypothetical protein
MREKIIKKDLITLSHLLNNWDKNVKNASILNTNLNHGLNGSIINYSLEKTTPLIFKHIDLDRHSIPSGIEKLGPNEKDFEVHLSIELSEQRIEDNLTIDPLISLGVSIKIKGAYKMDGSKKNVICSWHLDRDNPVSSAYCHPIYHLNFGGDNMTSFAIEDKEYFGNLLLLPNPRVIHPPLDIVLSCDFIIRNFYKKSTHKKITDLPTYKSLFNRAAKRYWATYAFAFASKWNDSLQVTNLSHESVIGYQ